MYDVMIVEGHYAQLGLPDREFYHCRRYFDSKCGSLFTHFGQGSFNTL
jgi:hypothetical protein